MTRFIPIIAILFLAGCSKLSNLNELLTLKSVADSQADMAKDVEATNKRFDALATTVKSGGIKEYPDRDKVRGEFGAPILERQEIQNDQIVNVWLYRHATEYFDADKVYLYFDQSGTLKGSAFIEGRKVTANLEGNSNGQIRQETPQ